MENNYTPPNSPLQDDQLFKGRISHAIVTCVASMITLAIVVILVSLVKTGGILALRVPAFQIIGALSGLLSGLTVLPFRALKWYWGIILGVTLGPFYSICILLFIT